MPSTLSPDEHDVVRQRVRETLQATPSYRTLDATRRRQLAHDLVDVVELLADPGAGDPRARAHAEALAIHSPLDALKEKHADVTGHAASLTGGITRDAVDAVQFPAFVSSLIKGVFEAIVQSSIEQMQAFTTFLQSVTRTTEQFEASITPRDTTDYLNQQFPGAGFSMMGLSGMMSMFSDDGSSSSTGHLTVQNPDKIDLSGWKISPDQLNTPAGMRALTDEARFRLARQKQQMLATLVMMGLNRIVVTDGKINARVRIQVRSQEVAQQNRQEAVRGALQRDETIVHHHHSMWGGSSTTVQTVPITIGVAQGSDRTQSEQELQTLTQLMGAVEVNFKSDVFPLEKLAAPTQMSLVQQAADPTHPGTRSTAGKAKPETKPTGGEES